MKINTLKDNFCAIWKGIKESFLSKDKNIITNSVLSILVIIIVAIVIKIPFIFLKTLLLDFLNSMSISYSLQNFIAGSFEFIYIIIAIIYIYKRLKNCFINQSKSI